MQFLFLVAAVVFLAGCLATQEDPIFEEMPHQQDAINLVWYEGFGATKPPPLIQWVDPDSTCAAEFPNSPPYMARLLGHQCTFGTYTIEPETRKPLVQVVRRGTIWESWFIHELLHAYLEIELGRSGYDHPAPYFTDAFFGPIADRLRAAGW